MCEQAWERQLTCAPAGAPGRPALVLVEGRAGTGKSELVRRLLESPGARGAPRLAVTFGPSGAVDIAEPAASLSHTCLPAGPVRGRRESSGPNRGPRTGRQARTQRSVRRRHG